MTPEEELALRERLADAALDWYAQNRAAIAARAARARFVCEREYRDGALMPRKPCWKTFVEEPNRLPDDYEEHRLDESEWCPICRAREVEHQRYRAATKARGIADRKIKHYAKRILEGQPT